MKDKPVRSPLPRGRIAQWSRERIAALSTIELRALFDNAQRLHEPEVAAACDEILRSRPRGLVTRPRLVTWRRACQLHGVSVRSGKWSRGGIRPDGAVLMGIAEEDVRRDEDGERYLLWAPNNDLSRPWSDTPGGLERLQHCRIALERGAAEGLLTYSKRAAAAGAEEPGDDGPALRADAKLLSLRVEKLGEEYWGRSSGPAAEAP
jgi:hypothetical protein